MNPKPAQTFLEAKWKEAKAKTSPEPAILLKHTPHYWEYVYTDGTRIGFNPTDKFTVTSDQD